MRLAHARSRQGGPPYPLAALVGVIIVFVALTSLIAVNTPAWETADEPDHVRNVETLAGGHWYRIPVARPQTGKSVGRRHVAASDRVGNEPHQPPLYYLLLAGLQRVEGKPAHAVDPGPGAFPFTLQGLYLHHRAADHRFVMSLRVPNILLGIVAILFTFLTARRLTSDAWTPVCAAAIVAFLPRLLFLSAFVTNDNLVNALGAILAYVAVSYLLAPATWRIAVVGAVLGLLLTTKLSTLPVVAVLVVTALAASGGVARLKALAIGGAAALAVSGWYLVQNAVRYGDPLALSASKQYLASTGALGEFGTYRVTDPLALVFAHVPARIWQTFWYSSGWDQFSWPGGVSAVFWVALAFSLIGLVRRRRQDSRATTITLAVLAVAGFASVWLIAFSTSSYAARLAFVGVPALACLAALGLERHKLPIRFLLPALELGGTLIAVQQHVLSVNWS